MPRHQAKASINKMATLSIIYLLSFLFTIPIWVVAHKGLLGEEMCGEMLEEARKQGIESELLDKDNTKVLVFMLGILTVTPIVNTVLAVFVIKHIMFK